MPGTTPCRFVIRRHSIALRWSMGGQFELRDKVSIKRSKLKFLLLVGLHCHYEHYLMPSGSFKAVTEPPARS